MIKTYDNSKRQFSRPYSAKTVFFYKDGDQYFSGLRVPITRVRYRNMDALLDRLNESIALPYGVRRLHTPYGRTPIRSVDDLQHMGKYIASSSKPRGLEVSERRKRERDTHASGSHFSTSTNYRAVQPGSSHNDSVGTHDWRAMSQPSGATYRRTEKTAGAPRLSYLPIVKQIFFTLNGHPSIVYRTVLNPLRRNNDFDALLEEISDGLRAPIVRLFTYNGEPLYSLDQLLELKEPRVIAVPRHHRLILPCENALPQLPPIFAWSTRNKAVDKTSAPPHGRNPAPVSTRRNSTTSTISTRRTLQNDFTSMDDSALNNINKWQNLTRGRVSPIQSPSTLSQLKHTKSNSAVVKIAQSKPIRALVDNMSTKTTTMISENDASNSNSNSNSSNTNTTTFDSDSGRPKSMLDFSDDTAPFHATLLPHDYNHTADGMSTQIPRYLMRNRRSVSDPTKTPLKLTTLSTESKPLSRLESLRRFEKRIQPIHKLNLVKVAKTTADASRLRSVERLKQFPHSKSQDVIFVVAAATRRCMTRAATPPPEANTLQRGRTQTRFAALPKARSLTSVSQKSPTVHYEQDNEHGNDESDEIEDDDDYPEHEEMREAFFRLHHVASVETVDEKRTGSADSTADKKMNSLGVSSDVVAPLLDKIEEKSAASSPDENNLDMHFYKHLDPLNENDVKEEQDYGFINNEHLFDYDETSRMHTINEEEDTVQSGGEHQEEVLASSAVDIKVEHIDSFAAAVVIQRHVRGYLVRKKFQTLRFNDKVNMPDTDDHDPISPRKLKDDAIAERCRNDTPIPKEEDANEELAQTAITIDEIDNISEMIQIQPVGSSEAVCVSPPPAMMTASAEVLAMAADALASVTATSPASDVQGGETHVDVLAEPSTARSSSLRNAKTTYTYTITVKTGNRWAADTEADLHIVLYGSAAQSQIIVLRQECVNWLQSPEPKFRQNQTDSFRIEESTKLGIIERIVVSHEHAGYGAGIFIERILVSEEYDGEGRVASYDSGDDALLDAASVQLGATGSGMGDGGPRQFLFLCNKWLDSGQVDGKLERSFRLSAFCYIHSAANIERCTKGRWEFIFNSGTSAGFGGTTSNLRIIGYGTRGQSTTSNIYDTRMNKVPSESLIQVDFGNIGDLLKVRVEIDGMGASPDYFLNFVSMRDLDTEECFVVMCGKWLRWKSTLRGAQPFRELLAFHWGIEPLPLIAYEGKLRVVPSKLQCVEPTVQMEFHGDLGETGVFTVPVVIDSCTADSEPDNKKMEISFKVEAVSIGRVYGARIFFRPTELGAELFEGFYALQKVFESRILASECDSTASDWLINSVLLRESQHTPYRYVLTHRKLLPQHNDYNKTPDNDISLPTTNDGFYIMDLVNSEMEGVSTRLRRSQRAQRDASNWVLSMLLGPRSALLPDVMLCGERLERAAEMRVLDPTPVDDIISYQLKSSKVSTLRKVRVSANGRKMLNVNERHDDDSLHFVAIRKMRICDTVNGNELRFPNADIELGPNSVYEFSAIWPDYPPVPIVVFAVQVFTGASINAGFDVRLNLRGQFGDVGQRTLATLTTGSRNFFQQNLRSAFEFEAVSIGDLKWAELRVDSKEDNFIWECREIVVTDSQTQKNYLFKFPKRFSAQQLTQGASPQKL